MDDHRAPPTRVPLTMITAARRILDHEVARDGQPSHAPDHLARRGGRSPKGPLARGHLHLTSATIWIPSCQRVGDLRVHCSPTLNLRTRRADSHLASP